MGCTPNEIKGSIPFSNNWPDESYVEVFGIILVRDAKFKSL